MANLARRAADWLHHLADLMRRKPRFVFDIETNGFLEAPTVIHCLVIKDVDTGRIYDFANGKYGPGSMAECVVLLASGLGVREMAELDSLPVEAKAVPGRSPVRTGRVRRGPKSSSSARFSAIRRDRMLVGRFILRRSARSVSSARGSPPTRYGVSRS